LYWNVSGENIGIAEDVLQKYFVDTIERLINEGKIVSMGQREKREVATSFSRSRLEDEVKKSSHPDYGFYWFGLPDPEP
jgi:polysaccharide pyruvyl transferase WcaK-like protein